jgi:hypothetical protein
MIEINQGTITGTIVCDRCKHEENFEVNVTKESDLEDSLLLDVLFDTGFEQNEYDETLCKNCAQDEIKAEVDEDSERRAEMLVDGTFLPLVLVDGEWQRPPEGEPSCETVMEAFKRSEELNKKAAIKAEADADYEDLRRNDALGLNG